MECAEEIKTPDTEKRSLSVGSVLSLSAMGTSFISLLQREGEIERKREKERETEREQMCMSV